MALLPGWRACLFFLAVSVARMKKAKKWEAIWVIGLSCPGAKMEIMVKEALCQWCV